MNKEELIDKIKDLEWEDFEVKEAKSEVPKSSWETVSAFANTAGGWLVFGVKQNGKIFELAGVSNPEKIENDFITTVRSTKFNVSITPECRKYKIDNKIILAFFIPISEHKPVYFGSQSNTYIRTGSGDQKATRAEIDAMFRNQAYGTKDKELTKFTIRDLHKSTIEGYREYLKLTSPTHHYNQLKTSELLEKLHVLRDGKITIGGLLVFGKTDHIENLITDFRVDYLEVPGTSYADAEVKYTYRINEEENLFQYFFSIMGRLIKKIDLPFTMTNTMMATDDQPQLNAIREALVNLLIHSDYFSTMKPRIRAFIDKIEFMNPGGLPKSLEAILSEDYTQPRNPIIARIFRVIKLAETAGSGFNKMFTGWQSYYHSKPIVEGEFDRYRIIFNTLKNEEKALQPNGASQKSSGESIQISMQKMPVKSIQKNLQKTLHIISENPEITTQELANRQGLSRVGISKQIGQLKKLGIIERVGSDRNGYWLITADTQSNISDININTIVKASEKSLQNTSEKSIEKTAEKIIQLISHNSRVTISELAIAINVSERTIERNIMKLQSDKKIKRVGAAKGGYWAIINKK